MPQLGDIAKACEVTDSRDHHKVIWHACEDCGAERWVLLRRGEPQSARCFGCSRDYPGRIPTVRRGPDHWHWQGGRSATTKGYVEVWLDPEDPLFAMAGKDGYVYEHRLVVARHLGRCLATDEEVHHRNGDKHDNDLSNLELLSKGEHAARHHDDVMKLLQQVAALEDQVRRLGGVPHEPPVQTP